MAPHRSEPVLNSPYHTPTPHFPPHHFLHAVGHRFQSIVFQKACRMQKIMHIVGLARNQLTDHVKVRPSSLSDIPQRLLTKFDAI